MNFPKNCRLRASANRAVALYPFDLTHLCLNLNSCLVEEESWKFRVNSYWDDEIASSTTHEIPSLSSNHPGFRQTFGHLINLLLQIHFLNSLLTLPFCLNSGHSISDNKIIIYTSLMSCNDKQQQKLGTGCNCAQ